MQHHLSKLTPISGGKMAGRINVIQEAIHALARGENITTTGSLKCGWGSAGVRLDGRADTRTLRGGAAGVVPPLTLVTSRPSYVPMPTEPVAVGKKRYYLTFGATNGTLADNWDDCVDLTVTSEETFYVAMKAFLNPTSDAMVVPSCEWITYTEAQRGTDGFKTPDFGSDGGRPEYQIIELATVNVLSDLKVLLNNIGGGSLDLRQYVSSIKFESGRARYIQALSAERIPY